ncbi:MAG: radical SAM protein [Nitrospirota bacterium]
MYSPFSHINSVFWKRRPVQLTFFITKRCNAKCPFCFYINRNNPPTSPFSVIPPHPPLLKGGWGWGDYIESEGRHQEELTLDEIEKISSSFGNLLWLAFSGGEIFLRGDIVEISRIFYKNNRPAIILYPTNGLLPDVTYEKMEAILKGCKNSTVVVKLSLDGLDGLHDELRGVEGSFEKFMQSYHLLSGLLDKYPNFDLGVNTVFYSENQDRMGEIVEFVNTMEGINTHTVSFVRGEINGGYKDVDIEKYRNVIEVMENNLRDKIAKTYRFKGAKLKAAQDILQRKFIYQTMQEKRRLIPCYAGRLNLVLTETGDVYPCESFDKRMGNIRDYNYDVKELLQSEGAGRVTRSIQKNGCYCTHECYIMTNILFNPRIYPRLAKEYLQL